MAKPQVENGHTKIANELLAALARINLSAYESRILRCIMLKTYGWNKKSDWISYSQFEEITGMERRHIGRTIKLLIKKQIITCQSQGQQIEYSIQKDYELWVDIKQNESLLLPKEATELLPKEAIPTIAYSGPNHCLIRAELLPKEATELLPKEANTKAIKHITKAIYKSKYGEFQNVLLTDDEYKKLELKFNSHLPEVIENLSRSIESHGYKYQSHYATILNWARRDEKDGKSNATNQKHYSTDLPQVYTKPDGGKWKPGDPIDEP